MWKWARHGLVLSLLGSMPVASFPDCLFLHMIWEQGWTVPNEEMSKPDRFLNKTVHNEEMSKPDRFLNKAIATDQSVIIKATEYQLVAMRTMKYLLPVLDTATVYSHYCNCLLPPCSDQWYYNISVDVTERSAILKRLRKPWVSWKRSTTIHFEFSTARVWRMPIFSG